jgi:hypothetical protein
MRDDFTGVSSQWVMQYNIETNTVADSFKEKS